MEDKWRNIKIDTEEQENRKTEYKETKKVIVVQRRKRRETRVIFIERAGDAEGLGQDDRVIER